MSVLHGLEEFIEYPSIFAFGLVLSDSFVWDLLLLLLTAMVLLQIMHSQFLNFHRLKSIPGIKEEIKRDFGFKPDFEIGKHYLEANDGQVIHLKLLPNLFLSEQLLLVLQQ